MNFGSDPPQYVASSYRKIFGDPLRSSSRLGSSTAGGSGGNSSSSSSSHRSASLSRSSYGASSRLPPPPPPPPEAGLDVSPAWALRDELRLSRRASEKEQLQGLNDRFGGYLERVRQLEQHRRRLEGELGALRQRHAEPNRLAELLFQGELRELRGQLEAAEAARAQAALERERLAEDVQRLRAHCHDEARRRAQVEEEGRAQQREADGAGLARAALEKKLEGLLDELAFVRHVQAQEVAELSAALHQATPRAAEPDPLPRADLTAALKELRGQYEGLAAKNVQAAQEWSRDKFADLREQAARSHQAIRASRQETAEYRRQLTARTLQAESLRGARQSLERQLREVEERHQAEAGALRDTISQLETDLRGTKSEMAQHLREYQDLLNVKMALDIEIAAYRLYSSSVVSSSKISATPSLKKEEKEEAKMATKISSGPVGEAFAEMIEEYITSSKKTE